MLSTPRKGKSTSGRSAVTGMGAASVIHQTIIHAATASVLFEPGPRKLSGTRRTMRRKSDGPETKATFLKLERFVKTGNSCWIQNKKSPSKAEGLLFELVDYYSPDPGLGLAGFTATTLPSSSFSLRASIACCASSSFGISTNP